MDVLKKYFGLFGLVFLTYTGLAWAYMLYNPHSLGGVLVLVGVVAFAWILWLVLRSTSARDAAKLKPGGVAVVALVGMAVTWLLWSLIGSLWLNRVRDNLIQSGYGYLYAAPTDVPPEENGAIWFNRSVESVNRQFALLDAKAGPGNPKPSEFIFSLKRKMPGGRLTDAEWAMARRLVAVSAPTFRLFETACRQDVWDWGVDWDKFYSGRKVALPEWGTPVSMMDLWLLKCFLEMREGKSARARADARKGLLLAERFTNDPWMGEFLYGSSSKVIYLQRLAPLWMGARGEGGEDWPDELSADREYARFLKIGRTVLLNSVKSYDASTLASMMGGGDPPGLFSKSAAWLYKPFLKMERAWLGTWGQGVLDSLQPATAGLDKKVLLARASAVPWNNRYSIWAFEYHLENVFTSMAQMRLHKAQAACRRYKAITGRWPSKVEDMFNVTASDNDLLDPFSSGFLRLIYRKGRPVFYSVGFNFIDDGGAPLEETGSGGDIVLTLDHAGGNV